MSSCQDELFKGDPSQNVCESVDVKRRTEEDAFYWTAWAAAYAGVRVGSLTNHLDYENERTAQNIAHKIAGEALEVYRGRK